MAGLIIQHNCAECALQKRYIEGVIDEDDVKVYNRINVKTLNAEQAASPDALDNLPEAVTATQKQNREAYFIAAFKARDEARDMLVEWWQLMKRKYNVPDTAKFDPDRKQFYECVDGNGFAPMDGEFIAKNKQ